MLGEFGGLLATSVSLDLNILTNMSIPAITIQQFNKCFGFGAHKKQVIHDLSLTIKVGEVFGFIGPNGAGKSTTIKSILGFLHADSGRFQVLGRAVGQEEFRQHIGYLPELPFFYDYLTAQETLTLSGKLSGMTSTILKTRVADLLHRMNLSDATQQRVGGFSKGMKQRLGMANALIHDPDILIFDEPMSGLDPIGRHQIKELMKDLKKDGKTIFFSSHILSDIEESCDRIGIIHHGCLLFSGTVPDFMGSSLNLEQRFVECIQEADDAINI